MKKKCKNCEYAENVEFGGELLLYVKDQEIERLNNIINELEKWCDIQFDVYKGLDKMVDSRISCHYLKIKDKLKELKGGE